MYNKRFPERLVLTIFFTIEFLIIFITILSSFANGFHSFEKCARYYILKYNQLHFKSQIHRVIR